MAGGAYGQVLGESFGLESAPVLITRALQKSQIAVTEIRCDDDNHGLTSSIPYEDAYLVQLLVRDCPDHELWVNGRPVPTTPYAAGSTSFYDLKRDPIACIRSPFHGLFFHLSRHTLDAIADEADARPIVELKVPFGPSVDDPTIRNLGTSLLSAFQFPEQASRLFLDHVTLAVGVHVAHAYGGMRLPRRPATGGLAPWQERRAKELLSANLNGDCALREIAQECGLSLSHFSKAFRVSVGMAPHQWLVKRRVDRAKDLLRNRTSPLAEVALASGFGNQSHFTRVFTREVGISPGAWRRSWEQ